MLDRMESLRTDRRFIEDALVRPATRFLLYAGPNALLHPVDHPIAPLLLTGERIVKLGMDAQEHAPIFLGVEGDVPHFAMDLACVSAEVRNAIAEHGRWEALFAIQEPVAENAWSMLAQARALLTWNERTSHCSRCGSPTELRNAGSLRVCSNPDCGTPHFPRTDSAVIVRVTYQDRCLLARQPSFRPGLQSVLAGFLEPGESLEDTVIREVGEEVGLELRNLTYVGSQPWPFPMTLMVGFTAESTGEEIHCDPSEIESAAWYTREEVGRQMDEGVLILPSKKSLSRQLIDSWLHAV